MSSRIPGFQRFTPKIRRERLALARDIPAKYLETFTPGGGLPVDVAGMMIENVIGVMSLPVGLGLNLLVNRRDYIAPMVVEEPSVVAAVSALAKVTRLVGGVEAHAEPSQMIGQIQILECPDFERASARLMDAEESLIDAGNMCLERLVARGGGVSGIEIREHTFDEQGVRERMLVVHVIVNTLDAMGANLVNRVVEALAPRVAEISGGRIGLRILSNLADRRLVRARVCLPPEVLERPGIPGAVAVDGIVAADRFAAVDPYRAATHNKGIMNGIDAVALATGNDWRAIEAGAHAYAARDGRYGPLSRWRRDAEGRLVGTLELPLAVGIVGGIIQVHPTVRANLHILGVRSAGELAEVMAAVGLVQNLAALRALASEGIQRGHMSLHARSVAIAAGVPSGDVPEVVDRMVQDGEISQLSARTVWAELAEDRADAGAGRGRAEPELAEGRAFGKVILLGEHAVVHGAPALASAIDLGVRVKCFARRGAAWVEAPGVLTDGYIFDGSEAPIKVALRKAFQLLDLPEDGLGLTITGDLPPGKGLGSSGALAIAALRALSRATGRELSQNELLEKGYRIEQVFHGLPSGIDHTVSALGGILSFRRGDPPVMQMISSRVSFPIVLLDSGEIGPTSVQVSKVLALLEARSSRTRAIFAEIETLVEQGIQAIRSGDGASLGAAMNRNHVLLQALDVSTQRLDELVMMARSTGAAGAKLTGAGGGGMVVALCPDGVERLLELAAERGINALASRIPAGLGDTSQGASS